MKKFTKKKVLTIIIASVLLLCSMTAVAFASGSQSAKDVAMVECGDCGGSLACMTCYGKDPACADCNGTNICPTCNGTGEVPAESKVYSTFWSLVPPIIAIGLALITKEVYSSLFIGIVSGALLAANFKFLGVVDNVITTGFIDAISGTAGIFAFLVILGIIVALVNKAGGSAAFGNWAKKNIKSRTGAALCTFLLGVLIFIDDYFNCLTVGSVMRPVTDSHKISRSKLAYLIDATAAPVCMTAPISSWAAAVSSYAEEGQGLKLFISAIPFNFYSLLTLVFIIAITLMKFDYGPMRLHEYNAQVNGDLYTSGDRAEVAEDTPSSKGKVIDLILPVVILIAICVFALVYNGGILNGSDFITAFSDTDATVALPWGGIIALVIGIIYLIARRVMTFKEAMECIPKGFVAMVPAILILTLATSLKNMTSALGAKYFVHDLMEASAGSFNNFLSAIIFLVACVLSFATGTSWGTFGILIPIVTSMFNAGDPLLTIGISACLAGAVCGDHCSPISDTTIMSSAGGQCNHLNHVSTQLPYALSVAGISFVMYIISGFVQKVWIALPIGVVITIAFLFVMKMIYKNKPIAQSK